MQDFAYGGNANQYTASTQAQMADAQQRVYKDSVTASPKLNDSEAALQRIGHQLECLSQNSQRLSGVADRLVGSRPKDVAAGGAITGNAQHMPLSAKLSMIADILSRLNGDNAESVERLELFI